MHEVTRCFRCRKQKPSSFQRQYIKRPQIKTQYNPNQRERGHHGQQQRRGRGSSGANGEVGFLRWLRFGWWLVVGGEESAAEETMLLWGIQQPTLSKPNAFVSQASLQLSLDSCGHSLSILQCPSSLGTPGVTGAVTWDSGVVLGKFLEHAVDSGMFVLQGKKIVELGSGCGLVGCIAALLGSEVIVTDLSDRLRLLRKNIETNTKHVSLRGSVTATELTWGEDPNPELIDPIPDFVIGSDVVYSEGAVVDLLGTLMQLSGPNTTIFLAGELRNDAILEYFLESAMDNFTICRMEQTLWHPDYCSNRVVLYVLVKK